MISIISMSSQVLIEVAQARSISNPLNLVYVSLRDPHFFAYTFVPRIEVSIGVLQYEILQDFRAKISV